MELKFQPVIFVLVNVYVQREVAAKTKKLGDAKIRRTSSITMPRIFLIRSVVSPVGAIENVRENAPIAGKYL